MVLTFLHFSYSLIDSSKKSVKTSSVIFDHAWKKIEPQKDPKMISNIRTYLTHKITSSSTEEGAELIYMLSGFEEFEKGFVKAADEVESLRQKNELLTQKLKDLGVSS
jgi:hypothetical protein